MMRPRLVILNNEILPYRVPLFRALANDPEFDLHVVFCTRRGWDRHWSVPREALAFDHTVVPGFSIRLRKPDYGERRTVYLNPSLMLTLLRLRPEVIVGYEYSAPALTALMTARLRGARYIVWTEGTAHSERHLTRGQRFTRRLIIPRAQAYLATSPAACENLARLGAAPARTIEAPQSHNVSWLGREADRLRPTAAPRPPTILYVGLLNERKGVRQLLEAFEVVQRALPEARLMLVGRGPLRRDLADRAADLGMRREVNFLDFVEPERVPEVFATADVFVLPSLEDTFGVVVVEAWASGVPVVCSRFAGAASYIRGPQDGLIVDPTQPAEMGHILVQLLGQPAVRQRMANRGKEIARQFDAPVVAERFRQARALALSAG
jgi:glycosyltransferase involved in cell wall biosynthesis